MKTKKSFENFKEYQLENNQKRNISGGDIYNVWDYDPKTGVWTYIPYPTSPTGGGNNGSSDAGAGIVNPKP